MARFSKPVIFVMSKSSRKDKKILPAEFHGGTFIEKEIVRWRDVIERAGLEMQ